MQRQLAPLASGADGHGTEAWAAQLAAELRACGSDVTVFSAALRAAQGAAARPKAPPHALARAGGVAPAPPARRATAMVRHLAAGSSLYAAGAAVDPEAYGLLLAFSARRGVGLAELAPAAGAGPPEALQSQGPGVAPLAGSNPATTRSCTAEAEAGKPACPDAASGAAEAAAGKPACPDAAVGDGGARIGPPPARRPPAGRPPAGGQAKRRKCVRNTSNVATDLPDEPCTDQQWAEKKAAAVGQHQVIWSRASLWEGDQTGPLGVGFMRRMRQLPRDAVPRKAGAAPRATARPSPRSAKCSPAAVPATAARGTSHPAGAPAPAGSAPVTVRAGGAAPAAGCSSGARGVPVTIADRAKLAKRSAAPKVQALPVSEARSLAARSPPCVGGRFGKGRGRIETVRQGGAGRNPAGVGPDGEDAATPAAAAPNGGVAKKRVRVAEPEGEEQQGQWRRRKKQSAEGGQPIPLAVPQQQQQEQRQEQRQEQGQEQEQEQEQEQQPEQLPEQQPEQQPEQEPEQVLAACVERLPRLRPGELRALGMTFDAGIAEVYRRVRRGAAVEASTWLPAVCMDWTGAGRLSPGSVTGLEGMTP